MYYQDFSPKDSWLIFRLDTQVADKSADVYMLMELPSGELLSSEVTIDEGLSPDQLQDFLQKAFISKRNGNHHCQTSLRNSILKVSKKIDQML